METIGGCGLVLNGGGGKGAYQIGVLKALMEHRMLDDVTAVAGNSIGSINAVLFAMGDMEKMEAVWKDIDILDVIDFEPSEQTSAIPTATRDGMYKLMEKYIDYRMISEDAITIYCAASEIVGNDESYIPRYFSLNDKSKEEIQKILLASTALPIIYDSVEIDGKKYRDGGLVDNEPIQPLYDLGLRKFIIIGLDALRVFDPTPFPDAEFIVIYPSHDLGFLISGTLNFDNYSKEIKKELGYKDGLRAIRTKFEKDPMAIRMEALLAEQDYQDVLREVEARRRRSELEKSVSDNLAKFNAIADKYGDL